MSESEEKKPAIAVEPSKKAAPNVVMLLVPALLAGGAAFGGAKLSGAHAATTVQTVEHVVVASPPPGPTVSLEPFVLLTPDAGKKMHAMKVSIAVEFEAKEKEDALKTFTPRIRDAALGYLRVLNYEDALDSSKSDKMRSDLLERFRNVGATGAMRVLITDLVVQ